MDGKNWCVEIWGGRGSFPRPEGRFLKYGGNTSCVSLEHNGGIIVLDAGSGLVNLGRRLAEPRKHLAKSRKRPAKPGRHLAELGRRLGGDGRESSDAPFRRVDILLSHLHLDHVQGLPMFQPFYDAEMEIHLYGSPGFERHLKMLVGPPYWPVGFSDFSARVHFHELRPGEAFSLNGLDVATMAGNHPGGSILYRVESVNMDSGNSIGHNRNVENFSGRRLAGADSQGAGLNAGKLNGAGSCGGKKSLVYALDCETDERISRELEDFAKEADFLLWDAGFTAEDMKPGWGHSTWEQGVEVRRAARAKKVVMMHYNTEYDDTFLQQLEEAAKNEDKAVIFAREGMKLC